MSEGIVYAAIEPCGCVAGVTAIRRPEAVAAFFKDMDGTPAEVVAMPVEEFRARPPLCDKHPDGPSYWPCNQAVPA